MSTPLALYIHWPFCRSKCPYCDFNSHVADSIDHAAWRDAYRREIAHYAAMLPGRRVSSVFFGGGTPSLMEPATAALVLNEIKRHWALSGDVEITLEANPNTAEAQRFAAFRAAGINRLSLGVQSLNDADLKFLGRGHDASEARNAIALAARHFPRFSFDLIYARQGQSAAAWEAELREALKLAGDHLSLYQLTIEPHTQFHTRARRGEILTAPDEAAVAMYEMTQDIMNAAGLPAYEISNHARAGHESRHNLTYWRYEDYAGIGPGAHGRYGVQGARVATENQRAPEAWLRQVMEQGHGLRVADEIDTQTAMNEALMMGLRLAAGIDAAKWFAKFGVRLEDFIATDKRERLVVEGYLTRDAETLRATAAGRQRLNAVIGFLAG